MMVIFQWQFWAVAHGVLALAAVVAALCAGKRWTALCVLAGVFIGAVLAVLPLWLLMKHSESSTGYGAGNAGVLFCCTVPIVPLIGGLAGLWIGRFLDLRRMVRRRGRCPACAYPTWGAAKAPSAPSAARR